MSSKQRSKKSNLGNLDPRIAPKEMIITRRKSALQKRQLRNKDRCMKSITKLIKGPPKSPATPTIKLPQKKIKSIENSTKKKSENIVNFEIEEKEFYPNTLKRNVVPKKIMLKPKYNMTVIAGTNKRKMGTPHRGLKSPPPFKRSNIISKSEFEPKNQEQQCQSPVCSSPELSMAEVIKLAEETHSLDDEDLMEILTCPSPVWWEDPPDSGYVEDAIFMSLQKQEDKEIDKPTSNEHKQTDKQIGLNLNIENRDSKFKQKRSKLENLLSSIKNKIVGCDNVPPNNSVKTKISLQVDVDKSNISESTEEEMFSDISFNDEDVLYDLESIDIPVESNDKIEDELNIIKENTKTEVPKNMPQLKRCPTQIKDSPKNSTDVETLSSDFDSISDINVRFIEEDEGSKTSDSSPKNNKEGNKGQVRARRKINKPIEVPEENTVTVSQSIDKEIVSDLGLNTDIEYITVYKIMSNKLDCPKKADVQENNEQPKKRDISNKTNNKLIDRDNKKKLNIFFKKCKNNRRNKKNKTKCVLYPEVKPDKNSILVSENNKVKYCYKCSSIFDTEECSYCKRKSNTKENSCSPKQCTCIDSEKCLCNKKSDFLTFCDFSTDTKIDFDERLLVQNDINDDIESVNNNSIKPDENQVECVDLTDQSNSNTNECIASS